MTNLFYSDEELAQINEAINGSYSSGRGETYKKLSHTIDLLSLIHI